MTEQKRKTPQIRFPEFHGEWEQRKFRELYEKSNKKNDGSIGIDKNITVATMQFKDNVRTSSNDYLKTYYIFDVGDIAFEGHRSKDFQFGRFVENDIGNGIVSHIFQVFKPIMDYDLKFWKYAINNENLMRQVLSKSTNASIMMHDLITDDFLEQTILVPSIAEQKQVGALLDELDSLITLHQHKLDSLRIHKKALLQKMFPKEGEKVPELRFPEFTDDLPTGKAGWEQCKVGDIATIISGNAWKSDDYTEDGEYLVVTIANVSGEPYINDKIGNHLSCDNPNEYLLNKDDILVSLTGNVGRVSKMTETKGLLNQRVSKIVPTRKTISHNFLFHLLRNPRFERSMSDASQGSIQKNISNTDILDYTVYIPSDIAEQTTIAETLDNIDNLITLCQKQLDFLKIHKKALLQKMFV